ncbi:MAG: NDP-sugar synthase [Syntrophobacter sp.]
MILAAGLGTRLLPLTRVCPKVLVPVRGIPVLDFWIQRLHRCGFDDAVLNAYHLKDKVVDAVSRKEWPINVEVHLEPVLLGTGGGIRTAMESFEDEPFAVINGDIICDAPLDALYREHLRSGAEVSLLLHDWPAFNNVAVTREGFVAGFGKEAEKIQSHRDGVRMLAFTGIHFVSPSAIQEYPSGIPGDIVSIYRNLIARGTPPKALFSSGLFWREMGSMESYMRLSAELGTLHPGFLPPFRTGHPIYIHPEAVVSPGVQMRGSVVVGRGARVHEKVYLENVILWENVRVKAGSVLKDCIVADGLGADLNANGTLVRERQ